ncbi:hypothetical protein GLYMA_12G008651v4 [Glycine max]|nr:hypothetical protein GLYMA_12G008651v4 [Glycine max]KAH1141009.1 hypothetical protein GYH30_032324 [Glycine max]
MLLFHVIYKNFLFLLLLPNSDYTFTRELTG